MTALNLFLVFLGAGLGGVCRYVMGVLLTQPALLPFAVSTLAVNLLGAFLAGLLFASVGPDWMKAHPAGLFLMTGFLGGLTTFSAFTLEGAALLIDKPLMALVHLLAHVLGCLLFFLLAGKLYLMLLPR